MHLGQEPAAKDEEDTQEQLAPEPPIVKQRRALRGLELSAARTGAAGIIVCDVRGPLSVVALRQAGMRLQRRHPSLRARCTVAGALSPPSLEFCEPDRRRFRFREIRAGSGLPDAVAPSWQRSAEHQFNDPFDTEEGFMFRVVWIPNRTEGGHIVVAASDVVADAPALYQLLEELLQECGRFVQAPTFQRHDASSLDSTAPPPSLLDATPLGARAWLRAKVDRLPRLLANVSRYARSKGAIDETSIETAELNHCRYQSGSVDAYRCVVASLEERNLELRYMVGAAAQFVLARGAWLLAPGSDSRRLDSELTMTMDFDLRGSLGKASRVGQIGAFLGLGLISSKVPTAATVWDLALELQRSARRQEQWGTPRYVHVDVERAVRAGGQEASPATLRAAAWHKRPLLHVGFTPRTRIPDRYGPLSLAEVFVNARSGLPSSPLAIWVSVFCERFHYSMSSLSSHMTRDHGARFLSEVVELVEHCYLDSVAKLPLGRYVSHDSGL